MQNFIKSQTRLAFIQFIFLSLSKNDDLNSIKNEFNNYFHGLFVSKILEKKEKKINYNKKFFTSLADNYIDWVDRSDIQTIINSFITFDRSFEKWDKINQSIILSIVLELNISKNEKTKIILNDYLNISKSFVSIKELKMINAIIDKYINEKNFI